MTLDYCTNNPSDASGFVYRPLDNPAEEVRLLILEPTYESERSRFWRNSDCSLRHVSLGGLSDYNYEALSYAWGSLEDGVGEICIEDKPVNVRINLCCLPFLSHNKCYVKSANARNEVMDNPSLKFLVILIL
jgi:hypothetical protein